jgi:hypothetical protein
LYSVGPNINNATLGYLDRDGNKVGFLGGSFNVFSEFFMYTNKSVTNFTPMAVPHFSFRNTTNKVDEELFAKLNRFGKREFLSELGGLFFHFLKLLSLPF